MCRNTPTRPPTILLPQQLGLTRQELVQYRMPVQDSYAISRLVSYACLGFRLPTNHRPPSRAILAGSWRATYLLAYPSPCAIRAVEFHPFPGGLGLGVQLARLLPLGGIRYMLSSQTGLVHNSRGDPVTLPQQPLPGL